MNLKEFGAKYPFLQGNLDFWEAYLKARDKVFTLLKGMIKLEKQNIEAFLDDNENKTPFLEYENITLTKKEINMLTDVFCKAMNMPKQKIIMPDKMPLAGELSLTTDVPGFIKAEIHAAIASYLESVITEDEDIDAINWLDFYCPLCGAHAGMGLINYNGQKNLICSHCYALWRHLRTSCSICGHVEEKGAIILSADEVPNWFIETCDVCKHSMKILDMRNHIPDIISYPLYYLTTWELDLSARDKGYDPALFAIFNRANWLTPVRSN